jgi:ABC-type dipeptide/oligopeptide/nickel transport system permease component
MGRLLFRQALRFVSRLTGAAILAAALATLSVPGATAGSVAYVLALLGRLGAMAQFDFGSSPVSGESALQSVAAALPYTAGLLALSTIVATAIGVPLGLVLGRASGRRLIVPFIQIVAATPVFCASLALAWLSVRVFGIHPMPPAGGLFNGPAAERLALPVLTVGLAGAGAVQLALHRVAAGIQDQPWRSGLRLMGLPQFEIDRLYVAPQMFAGLFANLGEVALAMVSAAAVTEWVFGWPGAAILFVKSLAFADWNVAALVLLILATIKFGADMVGAFACDALIGERPA